MNVDRGAVIQLSADARGDRGLGRHPSGGLVQCINDGNFGSEVRKEYLLDSSTIDISR